MKPIAAAVLLLFASTLAVAQQPQGGGHGHAMTHGAHAGTRPATAPVQPGQAAFAAIQEVVEILEADPETDWSKVDIAALRRHLVDMNNVTMFARAEAAAVDGGARFTVTGEGEVADSIRRMATAHAATMNGAGSWRFVAERHARGAVMTVTGPDADAVKIRALGFFGVMARGMHHQSHHLMIATGAAPHE
jgi:hypothetical protein